ncbi:hypothetical protein PVAND_006858 [Polypedilum vanderplanki]|uniref:Uncharacterized protein n=1 Tax=Polypedilum vanderplanki TaxID=319348 RepID=A0A9J6C4Y0_POLVA|nr:hypothetical protein PVAND_006858 [Polypedilum vanderplanki]
MSELQTVHRCDNCKRSCIPRTENIMQTPSYCVMIEANQTNSTISKDELNKKLNVWASASPPINVEPSPYSIDMLTLEKASAITKGTIVLEDDLKFTEIQSFEQEKAPISDDDDDDSKSVFDETFEEYEGDDDDDDDDETFSTDSS